MTAGLWAFVASVVVTVTAYVCVASVRWSPLVGEGGDERRSRPATALVLEMIAVAVRQGASIPRALDVIGGVCVAGGDSGRERDDDGSDAHDLGSEMILVARALNRGADWDNAWGVADPDGPDAAALAVIRSALEPSWKHGISPLLRIETTIEQIDRDERRQIEEAAAKMSVRVLVPMGLCFLPAFILIGVVPSIVSFATG